MNDSHVSNSVGLPKGVTQTDAEWFLYAPESTGRGCTGTVVLSQVNKSTSP